MLRPQYILIAGLPGSGKTYLADHLARKLPSIRVSSDRVRNELNLRDKYDGESKQLVYNEMLNMAETGLGNQQNVIIDATFHLRNAREPFLELGANLGVNPKLIVTTASEDTIKARTNQNRNESQADFSVYQKLKSIAEPFEKPFLTIDTGAGISIEQHVKAVLEYCLNQDEGK